MDLDNLLSEAIKKGRILISVPWIVEFMNGIDDTSVQLPCYKILLAKLQYLLYKIKLQSNDASCDKNIFCIYTDDVKSSIVNGHGNSMESTEKKTDNRMNISQLRELSLTATTDFTKRFVDECLQTLECSRILITLYVNSLFNNISVPTIINMEGKSYAASSPLNGDFVIFV